MKKNNLIGLLGMMLFVAISFQAKAQDAAMLDQINYSANEIEAHVRFLASDELMGRRTGEPGNNTAARYIAEQFRLYGLESVPGAEDDYFQQVKLNEVSAPKNGNLSWKDDSFDLGDNMVVLAGNGLEGEYKAVFANYGIVEGDRDDYKKLDVKGKVVFVLGGLPNPEATPQEIFGYISSKKKWAAERGAVALVEFYRIQFPWQFFANFFSRSSMRLGGGDDEPQIIHAMIQDGKSDIADKIRKGKHKVSLDVDATKRIPVYSRNVIGVVKGTDPELADEHLIITAHFDHVGTGAKGGGAFTEEDSIFNGARDNAVGTSCLLGTAKHIAANPLKRPVIFLAVTGEELGLLGSEYYADNPLVPLEKTIFNINTDGAGYNATDRVTLFGYDRTGTIEELKAAAKRYGLKATDDPAPEQGLFDRSDNVSFAKKGIPALTYSLGFTAFDDEINKYYHQVGDHADGLDYEYLEKYCQSFIAAAVLIGSKDEKPMWAEDDKYYGEAVKLYGLDE